MAGPRGSRLCRQPGRARPRGGGPWAGELLQGLSRDGTSCSGLSWATCRPVWTPGGGLPISGCSVPRGWQVGSQQPQSLGGIISLGADLDMCRPTWT